MTIHTVPLRITSIAVGLCLFGCATAPARYIKEGGSEEEMHRTLAACRVQAAMVPGDGAWGALMASATKDAIERAAKDDARSITSYAEKVLTDDLKAKGYLGQLKQREKGQ